MNALQYFFSGDTHCYYHDPIITSLVPVFVSTVRVVRTYMQVGMEGEHNWEALVDACIVFDRILAKSTPLQSNPLHP